MHANLLSADKLDNREAVANVVEAAEAKEDAHDNGATSATDDSAPGDDTDAVVPDALAESVPVVPDALAESVPVVPDALAESVPGTGNTHVCCPNKMWEYYHVKYRHTHAIQ